MGVCCVTRKEKNEEDSKKKEESKPGKFIYLKTDDITNENNKENNDKINEENNKNDEYNIKREEEIVAALLNSEETQPKKSNSLDFGGVPMDSSIAIKKKTLSFHKKAQKVKETTKVERNSSLNGLKMINNYSILSVLGQGAFGKVKLASKSMKDFGGFEKKYAIKVYKKANLRKKRSIVKGKDGRISYKDALQAVAKEIAVMKKLDHPNVIRLHEVIDDEEKDKIYMVLDYASKGQLIEWDEEEEKFYFCHEQPSNQLSEEKLKLIFRDCLAGMHYLHINHIIHRDIKPQNILFDENDVVKLADFGQSLLFEENDLTNATEGTYWFMAPELLDPNGNKEGVSGKACDIWSLGVTFFVFVFLQVPFYGGNIFELLEKIREEELAFPDSREISDDLKDVLRKMLQKNVNERISIEELVKEHWFEKNGVSLEKEIISLEEIIVNEQDMARAMIPIERAFFLKKVAKKLKESINKDSKEKKNE